jgi:outer membrane immunogenic protein
MPMKAPEPPPYQWSGCYVGFNVGGGTSGTNFGSTVDPGTYLGAVDAAAVSGAGAGGGGANADGVLGGGQAGCNLQSGMLVYGLEGDFDYFRSNPNFNNNTNTLPTTGAAFSIAQSLTTNFLATVRPRVGIAADRNFAYITGGAAFASVSYTETYSDANAAPGPGAGTASASRTLVGWTAGAGWEYALADHWTFKAEYLFVSFPALSATGTIVAPGGTNTLHGSSDLVVQLIRAGVNFKF